MSYDYMCIRPDGKFVLVSTGSNVCPDPREKPTPGGCERFHLDEPIHWACPDAIVIGWCGSHIVCVDVEHGPFLVEPEGGERCLFSPREEIDKLAWRRIYPSFIDGEMPATWRELLRIIGRRGSLRRWRYVNAR